MFLDGLFFVPKSVTPFAVPLAGAGAAETVETEEVVDACDDNEVDELER